MCIYYASLREPIIIFVIVRGLVIFALLHYNEENPSHITIDVLLHFFLSLIYL
jgi:hypothetical protein